LDRDVSDKIKTATKRGFASSGQTGIMRSIASNTV